MKLLLTSGGLSNLSIVSALKELLGKPFEKASFAFIPTAANVEEGDKWWLLNDFQSLRRLKPKSIDIVDISALPKNLIEKRLKEADVLVFGGGNTFHLMYCIKKSGLVETLPKLLKTKVYLGISAGSMIVTSSLILSSDDKDLLRGMGEEIYEEGLGYTSFLIKPHVNNKYFPGRTFKSVEENAKETHYPIYALDDDSAIKIDNGKTEVVSKGKWKKIERKAI